MSSDIASFSSSIRQFQDNIDGRQSVSDNNIVRSSDDITQYLSLLPSRKPSDSALCSRCRLIDFEYVGFHFSPEYGGNHYSVQREFASLLATSATCIFCWQMMNIMTKWLTCNSQDDDTWEIETARVEVSLETDWHDVDIADQVKAHSDRVRIAWSVPCVHGESDAETEHLTFFLQRDGGSFNDAQGVGTRINAEMLESCEIRPYSGRQRPLIANFNLFKAWKELCQTQHGVKCSEIFKGTPSICPRLIDVERRCLKMASESDRWVCISYVWGKTSALRLLNSNVQPFSSPGSLTSDILPKIAEDAIHVTRGLGERHLWIDSLCIVQDDAEDKRQFITQMDSIYALATVVIIAATCVDAESYLPGVRPGSRTQEQEQFTIRDIPLVQSLDPVRGVKVDLRTGRATSYLGKTTWDTRAWTLQERFLAARSLVFTPEQVIWECEEAFWCEDSFRDLPDISSDPHRSSLCGGELHLTWNSDVPTLDRFYRITLEEYSGRSLTYDSDGLNAFSGIIRAFERSAGRKFLWGLPTAFLESTLAWGSRIHRLRRRKGNELSILSAHGKDWFPSWSWAGWTGGASAKLDCQNLTTEPLGLEFYRVEKDEATAVLLEQAKRGNTKIDLLAEGSDILPRQSRPHKVIIDVNQKFPINHSLLLCFWTASVVLAMKSFYPASMPGNELRPEWRLHSNHTVRDINASWAHLPDFCRAMGSPQDIPVEAIAIAQNRGDWDGGHVANGAIGVMIITWEEGVAFRRGFAWIAIRDWTSLKDRTWRLITLA